MEHPSEEARKEYLKEHPNANPSNHTVTKQDTEEGPSKEEGEGEGKGGKDKPSVGTRAKTFLKGLSDKAKAFISNTSAEAQKFVADPEHRKKTLVEATKAIKASPKTYAKRVLETARHEVHEFKEAGEAIGTVIKGGKMTPKQKKAVKTVAIHMGIAVAAAALTSTGVLAGAAALGEGMARKIALKAAMKTLENVHLAQEIAHIGHGAHHLLHFSAKKDSVSPEEVLAILVTQSVTKELDAFSDEDLAEVLEEASEGTSKKAQAMASVTQVEPTLESMLRILESIPVQEFDRILLAARTEAETLDGRVWQKRFLPYLDNIYDKIKELEDPKERLQDIEFKYDVKVLIELIWQALGAVAVPRKASPDYAISDIAFYADPKTRREEITYSIQVLREWRQELEKWVKSASSTLRSLIPKVRRVIKTKNLV